MMQTIRNFIFRCRTWWIVLLCDLRFGYAKPCKVHYPCDVAFLGGIVTACGWCGKILTPEEIKVAEEAMEMVEN